MKLQAIAWWDWSRELLQARFSELNDFKTFIEKYS
jgi:hypothetical protein